MPRNAQMLVLLATLLLAAVAQQESSQTRGYHAIFKGSYGDVIELDTRTGTLDTPRTRSTDLRDCSDKFQVCLTDHHGFGFAYFRKCNDAVVENYTRLKFKPIILSVLHNNVWMVFDAAPNYLFHYVDSKGIVGIYIGPTASFDFRSVLRDHSFQLSSLGEFRITGSETVAACSE
jgi:hypothetical protein